ncbi:MAG: metallophosphoesterase, partial [Chloroflexota bacterium]|nr:metallophosphoesterase [Chloroflexota bacterium]
MRIAAIGDLHYRPNSVFRPLLQEIEREADLLVLAGDLTDTGRPIEMEVLLSELGPFPLPVVAVLGNHDHESGQAERLSDMLRAAGVILLDGTVVEVEGVGFVGTKGFCGGFGDTMIQPFGELALKTFIQEGLEEAVRLENALTKLRPERKVVVLHYAPIPETLEGEPLELYPFLGSARLANAIDRHGVDVIVHGHAHF